VISTAKPLYRSIGPGEGHDVAGGHACPKRLLVRSRGSRDRVFAVLRRRSAVHHRVNGWPNMVRGEIWGAPILHVGTLGRGNTD
jgi:hypothetical protein